MAGRPIRLAGSVVEGYLCSRSELLRDGRKAMAEDKQPFDIFREIEKLLREMMENSDDPNGLPKVLGFAITRKGEGEPDIRRMSSFIPFPPGMAGVGVAPSMLRAEVLEDGGRVYVTADVGASDETRLSLACDGEVATIDVDGENGEHLCEQVPLPHRVRPEPVSRSLNNGVLELVFEVLDTEVDVGA